MRPLKFTLPLFATCIIAMGATSATAGSELGIGVFGGINIPLIQDDAESGSIYGVRGSYALGAIALQPYYATSEVGDYDFNSSLLGPATLDGGELTIVGVDATLGGGGTGLGVYLLGGIGSYKLEYENGIPLTETNIGFTGGLGIRINMTNSPLAIDARGALAVIPLEDAGSRKYFLPTLGVSYSFGGGVK